MTDVFYFNRASPADIVTFPNSVDDICKIVKLCNEYSVPVIPHGTGTGLEHGIGAIMVFHYMYLIVLLLLNTYTHFEIKYNFFK